ncbi:MAG: acyl-CoA/acyl-ACP dehydrogenase [Acidimicrobiia bacterium]|nr:acyl-CoA/acyl-ACP dehydrogenase [Acidimicrobiia bacterium]MDH3398401.1 acyl-CoA/acyl-ACP dehydrogenase [Acidimicrobiia bacterium]
MAETVNVDFALTEAQEMLRQTTRQFLADRVPPEVVRELAESDEGFDKKLWQSGAELGWHSLAIPEAYGGAGYTFAELSVVLEEFGRALFPGPFLSTVVMAADAILTVGTEEQKQAYLPGIAIGEHTVAVALSEGPLEAGSEGITTSAQAAGDGWVLTGKKTNVIFGHTVDTLLVAARTAGGLSLFLVPADTSGVVKESVPTLDATTRQAHVTFTDAPVGGASLLGREGAGGPVVDRMLRLAAVALALDQVGGAQWCLETSVEHGKTRFQFGRAIGSFQAIKHRCADMLVAVEHARSTAYHAARVTEHEAELAIAAPLAKSVCSDAYLQAAGESIQILGGTGFTWEHDVHLYFKRAKSTALMFGDARHHRRLLADALGL